MTFSSVEREWLSWAGRWLSEVFADHLDADVAGDPFLSVELDGSQSL
jgi:hypothetical protein